MKVFVSSTFIDLKEYRKAVEEVLNRVRAQFQGMEYFGARPEEPKRACLAEIEESDVFVGIYAHRYGHVPNGDSKSITEQEFDFANQLSLPCYCYVIDPDYPWTPAYIEHSAKEQFQRFMAKVAGLVRERFTTPDDLAKKVAADLYREMKSQHSDHLNHQTITAEILREHCRQEIDTTIGPKYLRQLYIRRNLDGDLMSFPRAIVRFALNVKRRLPALEDLIGKVSWHSIKDDLEKANLAAKNADLKRSQATAKKQDAEIRQARPKKQCKRLVHSYSRRR